MKLTAPKTLVLVDLAVSGRACAQSVASAPDDTLACAVGAVSDGRTCGNF